MTQSERFSSYLLQRIRCSTFHVQRRAEGQTGQSGNPIRHLLYDWFESVRPMVYSIYNITLAAAIWTRSTSSKPRKESSSLIVSRQYRCQDAEFLISHITLTNERARETKRRIFHPGAPFFRTWYDQNTIQICQISSKKERSRFRSCPSSRPMATISSTTITCRDCRRSAKVWYAFDSRKNNYLANCFCKSTKDAYGGADPAIAASGEVAILITCT